MTTGSDRPDLVRRAAALLESQAAALSHPGRVEHDRAHVNDRGPELRALNGGAPAMPSATAETIGRQINLSPTVMAANGIFLPSAGTGFVPTIEEFRLIKRHVLSTVARGKANMGASKANRILVTSARSGDGKTFTAINLALSLAFEHDRRVLLIDTDAQRKSLLRYLGVDAEVGWIDMLSSDGIMLSDILRRTNIPNLSIIPSGKLASNMPELISSPAMARFISQLSESDPERLIIFDTLPCLVSNEPAIFAELVGQVVFVIAAGETTREEVQTALSLVNGCSSVGLVLNKRAAVLAEQFGKYGYGYYKNTGA